MKQSMIATSRKRLSLPLKVPASAERCDRSSVIVFHGFDGFTVLTGVHRFAVFILFAKIIPMVIGPFAGGAMLSAGSFAER